MRRQTACHAEHACGSMRDWTDVDWTERDWTERDWTERGWTERDWTDPGRDEKGRQSRERRETVQRSSESEARIFNNIEAKQVIGHMHATTMYAGLALQARTVIKFRTK